MIKNIEAAKELIKKYNSITQKDVKEIMNKTALRLEGQRYACHIQESLTGYGSHKTCTLCKATIFSGEYTYQCGVCIYRIVNPVTGCLHVDSAETYYDIAKAKTPKELVAAFKARAKYIRTVLKRIKDENN